MEPSGEVGRLEPMTEVLIRPKPKLRGEEDPNLPHESEGETDKDLLRDGLSRLVNLPLPHEDLIVRLAPLPGTRLKLNTFLHIYCKKCRTSLFNISCNSWNDKLIINNFIPYPKSQYQWFGKGSTG